MARCGQPRVKENGRSILVYLSRDGYQEIAIPGSPMNRFSKNRSDRSSASGALIPTGAFDVSFTSSPLSTVTRPPPRNCGEKNKLFKSTHPTIRRTASHDGKFRAADDDTFRALALFPYYPMGYPVSDMRAYSLHAYDEYLFNTIKINSVEP